MVERGHWSEIYVTWYAFVALDARMHLHTAFLLSCFGIASNTIEYEVREEADGRRIDNLELLHPLRHLARGAVRWKFVLVCEIKPLINLAENLVRASGIRIRERTASWKTPLCQGELACATPSLWLRWFHARNRSAWWLHTASLWGDTIHWTTLHTSLHPYRGLFGECFAC